MSDSAKFLLITLFLEVTPGPAVLFILLQSSLGLRHLAAAIGGLLSANLVWISLVATGLAVLITSSEVLFFILKIFGAIYLGYLGIKIIRFGVHPPDMGSGVAIKRLKKTYIQGMMTSFSNPKALIFFMALFPNFTRDDYFLLDITYFGFLKMLCLAVVMTIYGVLGKQIFHLLARKGWSNIVAKVLGGGIFCAALTLLIN